MSDLGARLLGFFVEPADGTPRRRAAARPPVERIGLLCAPGQALVLAGGLAGALRRRSGARAATAIVWGAPPAPAAFAALPAARRLARRLAARDLAATAAGRVARVALPSDPAPAAADAARALAGADAAGAPSVLAVAGPRPAALDEALVECGLLVVAVAPGAAPGLGAVAAAGAPGGVPVVACEVRVAPAAAPFVAAGLLAPGVLAACLDARAEAWT